MTNQAPSTQVPAQDAVAAFFGAVISASITGGETAAEDAIATFIPFLEAPGMNLITNWIVGKIGDAVKVNITNLVTMVVLDVQTKAEASSAVEAAANLQIAQASGDANAIQIATDAAISAYAALAQSNGFFTPT